HSRGPSARRWSTSRGATTRGAATRSSGALPRARRRPLGRRALAHHSLAGRPGPGGTLRRRLRRRRHRVAPSDPLRNARSLERLLPSAARGRARSRRYRRARGTRPVPPRRSRGTLLRRLGTRFFLSSGTTTDRSTAEATKEFAAGRRTLRLPHRLWLAPSGHAGG